MFALYQADQATPFRALFVDASKGSIPVTRRMRTASIGLALIPVLLATGCGLLGAQSSDTAPGNGLEKTKLRVAVLTVADAAPFWLAREGGYFKAQGIEVEEVPAADPKTSMAKLSSGEVDLAFITYTSVFIAQAQGADLKLVADGVFASSGTNMIVAPPNSPVKRLEDLPGRRVGISSKNAASDILTREVMRSHGLDPDTVKWTQVALPDMGAAMANGDLDAAFQPEPFLTSVQGPPVRAMPIYDAAKRGESTDGFPLTGYVAQGAWTSKNPQVMAAFQRAMFNATRDAGDRTRMEPLIQAHAKVKPDIAARMGWPGFTSRLDALRLQRVPDLLAALGALKPGVNVEGMAREMIVPQVTG